MTSKSDEATRRFYAEVWPHRAMVLRTAQFLVHNAAEAEDLAQETLMRAFRSIAQLEPDTNPKGWLTSILRHVRIDQVRKRGEAILSGAQALDDMPLAARTESADQTGDVLAALEEFSDQVFINALRRLPEEIRWAVLLVDVQQMEYEDAAALLDVPAGTIKSRIHRGRQMLRDDLLSANPRLAAQSRDTTGRN